MKTISSHLASMMRGPKRPRRRVVPFVKYVVLLTAIILVFGWLFHVIMAWEGQEHSWFTGVYWALTVMSTLGFGDITFTSDLGRVFSTVVLLTGILLLLILLPFLFIRLVYAPWLEEQSRRRLKTLRRLPQGVEGHVVICANDPIALGLAQRLRIAGVRSCIIEPDPALAATMHDTGIPVLSGEIDAVETYEAARADRARLVLANASDTVNTNIVLTVREHSPTVPIAAVADHEDSMDILELSGATHVLPLKQRLGEYLANRVSAGSARASIIGKFHDLMLAEFPAHNTPLQGVRIQDEQLVRATGARIVAVWERGRLLPTGPDLTMTPLSVPVVIGTAEQIRELDEMLVIYDANPSPVLVIGGGKVGRAAAQSLKRRGIVVHVVERNPELQATIDAIPDRLFMGDAADINVLTAAGVKEAPSVLLTTHDDAMNVYLTVYCRRLNPDARILTRVNHERNVSAIHRAGADFVLSYASFGVQTVFNIVQGQELTMLGEGVDLFYVKVPDSLKGKTLAEARVQTRTGLNVIAIREDGRLTYIPAPDQELAEGAVLVSLGSQQQRHMFDEVFG